MDLSKPFCAEGARIDPVTETTTPAQAERLISEGLISLREAARLLPRTSKGKFMSTSAIFRWCTRGKNGVRLEYCRLVGPGLWTSRPAIARFSSALTRQHIGMALLLLAV